MNNDIKAIIAKGILGSIPYVGPIASEIVGSLIPNQRIDRIEKMLIELEHKIESVPEKSCIIEKLKGIDKINIFEDVLLQVSRTIEEERINHLASVVKNSISRNDYNYDKYKKLLQLISEVSEIEVIILKYYSLQIYGDEWKDFQEKNREVLEKQIVSVNSPIEEINDIAFFDYYRNHLNRLSLLDKKYKNYKKDEIPDFDLKTGGIKSSGFKITRIGIELLKVIDEYNNKEEQ
jgi:hypothetical protein